VRFWRNNERKRTSTYSRCSGTELINKATQISIRHSAIHRRFRLLEIPICNQFPAACTLSISSRVGDNKSCMQLLLIAKSTVEMMLIINSTTVMMVDDREQDPVNMTVAPLLMSGLLRATPKRLVLRMRTKTTNPKPIETDLNHAGRLCLGTGPARCIVCCESGFIERDC
jgi:hypothetical protein